MSDRCIHCGGPAGPVPRFSFEPMKRTFFRPILLGLLSLGALDASAKKKDVRLHLPQEMNTVAEPLDSHAGEERFSVLEPVFEYMQLIPAEHLKTDRTAIYPRVKQMADGRYILFCQGGQIASRIYYYTSDDLKHWSEGRILFEPREIRTSEGSDRRCYSTTDAVVLANGDLLAACSFRASGGYKRNIGCGIVLKRSRDNGRSWSEEQVIFEGTNWEPYLLQLPDGRVQCYFTDCLPATRNSGTSVITSDDDGRTWHGHMRVCRQYKYDDRGVKIFTDQMPCFRVLNDGKTLLGFLEARLEPEGPGGKSIYMMSVVRNRGFDWTPLGEQTAGPADRETNVLKGCAGYVSVFPSGETLVSCNIDRLFSLKIGDREGHVFNGRSWEQDWFRPFSGRGFWGSLEPLDSHRVIGTMHCDEGIQLGVFYLNHRIDAPHLKMRLDGDPREWSHDHALFIGGDSPAKALFRAGHNGENFCLLVETAGCPEDCRIELRLGDITLSIAPDGEVSGCAGAKSVRRRRLTASGEAGYATEITVPLRLLGVGPGDTMLFYAALDAENLHDTFTFAKPDDPESWMRIVLK